MSKTVSLEQALEYCLQELARTGNVEASLGRYPQYAEQLRPLLETAQLAHQHYRVVPQAPGGLAAGRERMLAEAARLRARGGLAPIPRTERKMRLALVTRLVAALLVAILGLAGLGGGAAWAASDSLPGDLLYPLKLATEDVRLALASGPEQRVKLELQFVAERVDEVQELAAKGQTTPDETVARLERHIERAVTQAQAAGAEKDGLLLQIIEQTRTQAHKLEQLPAPSPAQFSVGRAVTACRKGVLAAESALDAPQPEPTPDPEPSPEPRPATATLTSTQTPTPTHTLTSTPHATPQNPSVTPQSSSVTPQGPRDTSSPRATFGPRVTTRPRATMPQVTMPPGPSVTPQPRVTPPGPSATPQPRSTSSGSQGASPTATPAQQATSPGPQGTPSGPTTPPGPKGTSQQGP